MCSCQQVLGGRQEGRAARWQAAPAWRGARVKVAWQEGKSACARRAGKRLLQWADMGWLGGGRQRAEAVQFSQALPSAHPSPACSACSGWFPALPSALPPASHLLTQRRPSGSPPLHHRPPACRPPPPLPYRENHATCLSSMRCRQSALRVRCAAGMARVAARLPAAFCAAPGCRRACASAVMPAYTGGMMQRALKLKRR